MFRIVTIGVEPKAMAEWCLGAEFVFRYAFDVVNQPAMNVLEFSSNIGQGEVPFLLGHHPIEGINSAVIDRISRRLASLENGRQMLQRLLFPRCYVGEDVADGPLFRHSGLQHIGIR